MTEASKKHKFCSICNARLDKIKRHNYSQVFKSDLVEKLQSLNPDLNAGDYVCDKHAKQANSLILESSKIDSFNNPSINLLIVQIYVIILISKP